MTITRLDSNARMSQIVVHGDTVYLAGVVADQPAGKDVTAQTESVLGKIDASLAKVGSDKAKILSAQIWLADMANFQQMNAVWDAWVAPGHPPARATVEAKLATPDYKVEIMVVAAK